MTSLVPLFHLKLRGDNICFSTGNTTAATGLDPGTAKYKPYNQSPTLRTQILEDLRLKHPTV